jgi:hypothetical protein
VLAASETCSASQTPALNPAKKISQVRGYSLCHVNAQSLSAPLRTLIFVILIVFFVQPIPGVIAQNGLEFADDVVVGAAQVS